MRRQQRPEAREALREQVQRFELPTFMPVFDQYVPSGHFVNTKMDDTTKAAFASATETVNNTLTLASAILTVSVTFLKDVNTHPSNLQTWTLEASWVCLLLSAVLSVVTLAAITGTLARTRPIEATALYNSNIARPMAAALFLFLLGLSLTAAFGISSV